MKNWILNKNNKILICSLGFIFILFSVLFFVYKPIAAADDVSTISLPISHDYYENLYLFRPTADYWNQTTFDALYNGLISNYNLDPDEYNFFVFWDGVCPCIYAITDDYKITLNDLDTTNGFSLPKDFSFTFEAGGPTYRSRYQPNGGSISYSNSGGFSIIGYSYKFDGYHWYTGFPEYTYTVTFLSDFNFYYLGNDHNFFASAPSVSSDLINFGYDFSPVGEILETGFHHGEAFDTWNTIQNKFGSYNSVDSSDPIIDQILGHLKNFIYYFGQLIYYLLRIYDSIYTFFFNFWDNLKILFSNLFNSLLGLFPEDSDQDQSMFSTWLSGFQTWLTENLCKIIFGNSYSLGLDDDNLFNLFIYLRRLIIPDNLDNVKSKFTSLLNQENDNVNGLYLTAYNSYKSMINDVQGGVVPTFTVPAFTIAGITIPEQIISFSFMSSQLPLIHNIIAIFMYIGFAMYLIKEIPSILAGLSSSSDKSSLND